MALKLSFRDNSEHESGFHVYRSDAPMDPRNLPKPYKDLGRNSSVVIDEDFGGIFDQRRYYRVAAYVKGGNRSVSEEAHAGYDGKSPTLNLDFASLQYAVAQGIGLDLSPRAFSDLITFTRASGAGRFNASGQYEWLAADQPRFDYDPVTGECRGLLIEEQRTNLLTNSSTFSERWQSRVNELAGVRGFAKTTELIAREATTGAHQWKGYSATLASGGTYTMSLLVKAGASDVLRLKYTGAEGTDPVALFDLVNGYVIAKGPAISNATIQNYGGGYWLASITAVQGSATTSYMDIGRGFRTGSASETTYDGDGVTVQFTVLHNQIEAGSFPTSLIPTTTAQVTRAADIASVNVLSPWYNPAQGTLFVEAAPSGFAPAANTGWLRLDDGTTANVIEIRSWGPLKSIAAGRNAGGVAGSIIEANNQLSIGTISRVALTYDATTGTLAEGGDLLGSAVYSALPSGINQLRIGLRSGVVPFTGHIKQIRYFPRRLPNTELQAMTA